MVELEGPPLSGRTSTRAMILETIRRRIEREERDGFLARRSGNSRGSRGFPWRPARSKRSRVGHQELRMLDQTLRWVVEPGTFDIQVGPSSVQLQSADLIVLPDKTRGSRPQEIQCQHRGPAGPPVGTREHRGDRRDERGVAQGADDPPRAVAHQRIGIPEKRDDPGGNGPPPALGERLDHGGPHRGRSLCILQEKTQDLRGSGRMRLPARSEIPHVLFAGSGEEKLGRTRQKRVAPGQLPRGRAQRRTRVPLPISACPPCRPGRFHIPSAMYLASAASAGTCRSSGAAAFKEDAKRAGKSRRGRRNYWSVSLRAGLVQSVVSASHWRHRGMSAPNF